MIQVKSFEITDDVGINGLLNKYTLASGGQNIFISNGRMLVMYEDGEYMNTAQEIISLKEQRNSMRAKLDLIIHSQVALEVKNEGINKQIKILEDGLVTTGGTKEAYDNNKPKETEIKRLNKVLEDNSNQMVMNQAEITHYMANIEAFNRKILELVK